MKDNYYFKKYGIDVSCEIESLFEIEDSLKLNAIKMLLDNIESWWGLYFNCEQEKIEYNKLKEIIEKLNDLIETRYTYIKNKNYRICNNCNKEMNEGYCIENVM